MTKCHSDDVFEKGGKRVNTRGHNLLQKLSAITHAPLWDMLILNNSSPINERILEIRDERISLKMFRGYLFDRISRCDVVFAARGHLHFWQRPHCLAIIPHSFPLRSRLQTLSRRKTLQAKRLPNGLAWSGSLPGTVRHAKSAVAGRSGAAACWLLPLYKLWL